MRVIHLTFAKFEQFLSDIETSKRKSVTMLLKMRQTWMRRGPTAVCLSLTDTAELQGRNAEPAPVTGMDVNHRSPDYILIKVHYPLFSPDNITLGSGDTSFGVCVRRAFSDRDGGTMASVRRTSYVKALEA